MNRAVTSYDSTYQKSVQETLSLIERHGISVHTHTALQQQYAILDPKIVWYGSVDFLSLPGMIQLRYDS